MLVAGGPTGGDGEKVGMVAPGCAVVEVAAVKEGWDVEAIELCDVVLAEGDGGLRYLCEDGMVEVVLGFQDV